MPTSGGSPLVKKETTKFDDWPLDLGPHFTSAKIRKVQTIIHSYRSCFAFSLQDLEGYKGKSIHIQLEDDHPIFRRPYRLSVSERIGVQAHCRELLAARLIELSNGEFACATVVPSNNDIFGEADVWVLSSSYRTGWTGIPCRSQRSYSMPSDFLGS